VQCYCIKRMSICFVKWWTIKITAFTCYHLRKMLLTNSVVLVVFLPCHSVILTCTLFSLYCNVYLEMLIRWLLGPIVHRVSKNSQNRFCHTFVKFLPTLIIFGIKMAKTIELWKKHSIITSANLCQCTTVWNTDASNCYIIYAVVTCSGLIAFASLICNVV